jgi:tRNA modification GTPase
VPYLSRDDIAQIGTANRPAPLGALRLSGPGAFAILAKTSSGLEETLARPLDRSVHSCRLKLPLIRHRDGEKAAEAEIFACPARAFLMPAPLSYTREDMVELHLPGSPALLAAGLAALIAAGAREAAPGEFTFRAFRNGRLSLGQAEAVEEIIRAADETERRAALFRLGDENRQRIQAWRGLALDLAARVEAVLDFSDEELGEDPAAELAELAAALERDGIGASRTPEALAPDLPRVALAGRANAGKSSLFNRLTDGNAAIVSSEPSTTHDTLRREAVWEGTRLLLSDNPGLHPDGSDRERQMAELGLERLAGEDIVCWTLDASRPLDAIDRDFAGRLAGEVVVLLNKCDLPGLTTEENVRRLLTGTGLMPKAILKVSAATGSGLGELRRILAGAAAGTPAAGRWNRREMLEMAEALAASREAAAELAGAGRLELAADSLRRAAESFSRTLGEGYAETVLERIFSRFCLGK